MTAAAAHPPPGKPDFSTPETIRAYLPSELVADFDASYAQALKVAAERLRLDELHKCLAHWRLRALAEYKDPGSFRRIVATAEEILRTGKPRPGSVPWETVRARLRL